ncbi:MAG: hypothetical protein Harvfovirus31_15 [Harvfovirus sp.]|uniref:Uncharacterized protein n=1 Tax=Harvfovirus sp. TaxID=2487768 RepID=A0A3G5A7H2_9VIRU|nr:MAG: hypothetical protein Harvfovirus31_15 [Harvfovirus sp.]
MSQWFTRATWWANFTFSIASFQSAREVVIYSRINRHCRTDTASNQSLWQMLKDRDQGDVKDMLNGESIFSLYLFNDHSLKSRYFNASYSMRFKKTHYVPSRIISTALLINDSHTALTLKNSYVVDKMGMEIFHTLVAHKWLTYNEPKTLGCTHIYINFLRYDMYGNEGDPPLSYPLISFWLRKFIKDGIVSWKHNHMFKTIKLPIRDIMQDCTYYLNLPLDPHYVRKISRNYTMPSGETITIFRAR